MSVYVYIYTLLVSFLHLMQFPKSYLYVIIFVIDYCFLFVCMTIMVFEVNTSNIIFRYPDEIFQIQNAVLYLRPYLHYIIDSYILV